MGGEEKNRERQGKRRDERNTMLFHDFMKNMFHIFTFEPP